MSDCEAGHKVGKNQCSLDVKTGVDSAKRVLFEGVNGGRVIWAAIVGAREWIKNGVVSGDT